MTRPTNQLPARRVAGESNPWPCVMVPQNMDQAMALALEASRAGFYGLTPPQALMAILEGNQLGIPPLAAIRGIHVIEGRPELSAGLIANLVRRSGYMRYRVAEAGPLGCRLEWLEKVDGKWERVGFSSFDMHDAARMGKGTVKDGRWIASKPGSNWAKFPEDMCFARALTRGFRRFCAELGYGAIYAEGEISDADDGPRPTFEAAPETTRTNPPEPRGPQPEAELVEEHRDPKPEPAQAKPSGPPELLLTGEEIRAAREALGLTMSDFGRAAGLTARQVSAVERGKAKDPELYARCGKALATAAPAAPPPPPPPPAPAPAPEPEPDEEPMPAEEPEPCPICAGRLPCSASAGCGGGRTLEAYERRERERKAAAVWALARTKLADEDDLENVAARLDSCTTLDEIALVRSMVLALSGEEPLDQPKQTAPSGWRAAKQALDAELEPTDLPDDLEGLRAHVHELACEIRDDAKRAKLQALIDQAKDVARLEVLLASAERGLEAQRGDDSEGEVQLPPGMEHAAGEVAGE